MNAVFFLSSFVSPFFLKYMLVQFPYEVRSTLNGVSAALGKFGAFVGSFVFPTIVDLYGYPTTFFICSGIAFMGLLTTEMFVPAAEDGVEVVLVATANPLSHTMRIDSPQFDACDCTPLTEEPPKLAVEATTSTTGLE